MAAVQMRTLHRVGTDFASDITLTWYGRGVLDVAVGGRGMAGPRRDPQVGREIDQGATLFLWCEAALIPSASAGGTGVTARQDDATTVRLEFPLGDGLDRAWLAFDGRHPSRFSALRYKAPGGEKVWWHVDFRGWRPVAEILLPAYLEVTRADEGRLWFRMRPEGFSANVVVDRRLDEIAETTRAVRARRGLPD